VRYRKCASWKVSWGTGAFYEKLAAFEVKTPLEGSGVFDID
jgi:hypothetical protein